MTQTHTVESLYTDQSLLIRVWIYLLEIQHSVMVKSSGLAPHCLGSDTIFASYQVRLLQQAI